MSNVRIELQPIKSAALVLTVACAILITFPHRSYGSTLECRDHRGLRVLAVRDLSESRIASARMAFDGTPVIHYNPDLLRGFSQPTRLWWYAHECAHHALGHLTHRLSELRETEADCWATYILTRMGLVNRSELATIYNEISALPGDGWVYLPGPARAVSSSKCSTLRARSTGEIKRERYLRNKMQQIKRLERSFEQEIEQLEREIDRATKDQESITAFYRSIRLLRTGVENDRRTAEKQLTELCFGDIPTGTFARLLQGYGCRELAGLRKDGSPGKPSSIRDTLSALRRARTIFTLACETAASIDEVEEQAAGCQAKTLIVAMIELAEIIASSKEEMSMLAAQIRRSELEIESLELIQGGQYQRAGTILDELCRSSFSGTAEDDLVTGSACRRLSALHSRNDAALSASKEEASEVSRRAAAFLQHICLGTSDAVAQLSPPKGHEKIRITACVELARLLQDDRYEDLSDRKRALTLLTGACDKGDALGCFHLGRAYAKGLGVARSDAKAIEALARACTKGRRRHHRACAGAASLLTTTADASIRDGTASLRYARMAIEGDDDPPYDFLEVLAAAYAQTGDYAAAARTQERAIKKQEPQIRTESIELLQSYETKRDSTK